MIKRYWKLLTYKGTTSGRFTLISRIQDIGRTSR